LTDLDPPPDMPGMAWPEGVEHFDLTSEGADDEMRGGVVKPR
jgi:hypothetical protein